MHSKTFKSKRYRDKLRTEIKALEVLIPIDRSALHRKLDSQTVFRLCISFFRLKILFKALSIQESTKDEHDGKPEMTEIPCGNPESLFSGQNCFQVRLIIKDI
ncbi:hypothetical protein KUTeg_014736 [Tegillarca granosa]|uniref:BHLH domain-containing protein n=1 Tax=Tegillarca granosa TaxID=220873 RepID=A0ABQ9ER78_TEGGR|nr:hypothetical protein KUTeg_014736 [Tegillarca granosa]